MRVLHAIKTTRGATWALRQVAALHALGTDVVVALPSVTDGLAPRYAEVGVEVVAADLDVTAQRPWRLAGALDRCRALVERVKPDLIHSHFVSTTVVLRLALGRAHPIPRLFQVPGPLHLEHGAFRRLDLLTAGRSDVWVASCRWTYEAYRRRGVPPERLFLSYYGTDLEHWEGAARGALRRELGVGAAVPLVGMVAYTYGPKWILGQRRGIKGHEDFIDAVALARRVRPEIRGVIVGGTWASARRYERCLRARARRACGDAIHFTGARTDIPAVYADLDVAVHPSLSENCGGAVESLAAGCPTVASAVGGLPDVVIDGETGWLVPPRDPGCLARAMLVALADRDEARRRGAAGRRLVGGLFAIERTACEIAGIYRRLLGEASEAPQERAPLSLLPRVLAAAATPVAAPEVAGR